jgi:hypothetical protein
LLAEDRVAIRDQGLGSGTVALFGANIIYDGVAIGTFQRRHRRRSHRLAELGRRRSPRSTR